jgi:hypothetical protein
MAAPFDPLSEVEVFPAGQHREGGREYTHKDLLDMARNFARFSTGPKALVRVPAVLGHSEDQQILKDSGIPAAAWPKGLKVKGKSLYADFREAPPKVKRLLKSKAYRTVSAEVYDSPPRGVPGTGCMLRRVAFLGGELPEIKTIDEILALHDPEDGSHDSYSEYQSSRLARLDSPRRTMLRSTHATQVRPGVFHCFSEVTPMNPDEMPDGGGVAVMDEPGEAEGGPLTREKMLELLGRHGVDSEALESCDDAALAEMLRVLDSQPDEDDEGNPEAGDPLPEETGEAMPLEAPPEEDESGKPASPFAEPDGMSKDEAMGLYTQHLAHAEKCRAYADSLGDDGMGGPAGSQVDILTQPVNGAKKKPGDKDKAEMFAEAVDRAVQKALRTIQGAGAEVAKFSEARRIDAVLDRLDLAGKVAPGERAAHRENMLALSAVPTVHKFSEGGASNLLDRYVRQLERRPSLFSEKVRDGDGPSGEGDEAIVSAHWERFSEAFKSGGTSKEEFVGVFKTRQKADPMFTAAKYLGKK